MTAGPTRAGAAAARTRVEVPANALTSYDVLVGTGSLQELPSRLGAAAPASAYAVITPVALASTYGRPLVERLLAAGMPAHLITFEDGEAEKTRESWARLTDEMFRLRLGRDCCVVALGGGVTGDLAGFVAATYMRGVPVVQVPTTLLAMVDASVGGKTGVDTAAGKNLVGAFHWPRLVVIDPAVLRTLPPAVLRAGMAEAVKHGVIADVAYLEWIEDNTDALLALDLDALEHLVRVSVGIKAAVVSEDPREDGRRAILNFGHTVGHALELASGYGAAHGDAVAAGMVAEALIGEHVGITQPGTAARIEAVLQRIGLPVRMHAPVPLLMDAMQLDKKARGAVPRYVLLRAAGECAADERGGWTHAVAPAHAADVLTRLSAGSAPV